GPPALPRARLGFEGASSPGTFNAASHFSWRVVRHGPTRGAAVHNSLMNRVVVVTGASGGIGAAIARELGRRGAGLVLASRTADALERVAAHISSPTQIVTADVTQRIDVERIRDEAIAAFGHVDV